MSFPEKPTCHEIPSVLTFSDKEIVWRSPKLDCEYGDELYRTCSYCGSIHPEDLLAALAISGSRLSGSDWKYGWPHKFYLDVPNPNKDTVVKIGCSSEYAEGKRIEKAIMGTRETLHFKWYNEHLLDVGYSEDDLAKLIVGLRQAGIFFTRVLREDGKFDFGYSAPTYQAV